MWPSIIDTRARYRAVARRLRNTVLDCPVYVIFLMLNIYVADQDQGLEALSKVISRQKEIAETIGSEVDLQNGKLLLWIGDPVLYCQPS